MIKKLFMLATSLLALSGCATGPMYSEVSSNIPSINNEQGRIYFFRNAIWAGDGLRPDIKLNDEVIGESIPGGFFFIDKEPGKYEVTTSTEVEKKLTFNLDKNETKYVRSTVGMGVVLWRVYPELVTEEEALKEIMELHYIGDNLNKQ